MTKFTVFGSAKIQEITLSGFDYSQSPDAALSAFATLVAKQKAEIRKSFNELCHVCFANACKGKTQKERHAAIQSSRDAFFEKLPKKYGRAYAKAITALEWGIPENFDAFDFSDFLESEKKEAKPKERGSKAIFNALQKKYETAKKQSERIFEAGGKVPQYLDEELATYALLLETLEQAAVK